MFEILNVYSYAIAYRCHYMTICTQSFVHNSNANRKILKHKIWNIPPHLSDQLLNNLVCSQNGHHIDMTTNQNKLSELFQLYSNIRLNTTDQLKKALESLIILMEQSYVNSSQVIGKDKKKFNLQHVSGKIGKKDLLNNIWRITRSIHAKTKLQATKNF